MSVTRHFSIPKPVDDVPELSRLFKILANPNRLRILFFLLDNEVAVGEIESSLQIKQPSLSHELKILRDADLVKTKRQSKVIFYSLKSNSIKTLLISVHRLMNKSKRGLGHQAPPGTDMVQDTDASECGLFASIQQQAKE
jgi:ArsR family transcriptional regulator